MAHHGQRGEERRETESAGQSGRGWRRARRMGGGGTLPQCLNMPQGQTRACQLPGRQGQGVAAMRGEGKRVARADTLAVLGKQAPRGTQGSRRGGRAGAYALSVRRYRKGGREREREAGGTRPPGSACCR
eukprot:scaffold11770_cov106-Isochrysis_galbana.AAC.2